MSHANVFNCQGPFLLSGRGSSRSVCFTLPCLPLLSLSLRAPYLGWVEQWIALVVTLRFTPTVNGGDGHGGDEMLMELVALAPPD